MSKFWTGVGHQPAWWEDVIDLPYFYHHFTDISEVTNFALESKFTWKNAKGAYFLRPSLTRPQGLNLTVNKGMIDVRHFGIVYDEGRYLCCKGRERFSAITGLIRHHEGCGFSRSDGTESDIRLTHPIITRQRDHHDHHHHNNSSTQAKAQAVKSRTFPCRTDATAALDDSVYPTTCEDFSLWNPEGTPEYNTEIFCDDVSNPGDRVTRSGKTNFAEYQNCPLQSNIIQSPPPGISRKCPPLPRKLCNKKPMEPLPTIQPNLKPLPPLPPQPVAKCLSKRPPIDLPRKEHSQMGCSKEFMLCGNQQENANANGIMKRPNNTDPSYQNWPLKSSSDEISGSSGTVPPIRPALPQRKLCGRNVPPRQPVNADVQGQPTDDDVSPVSSQSVPVEYSGMPSSLHGGHDEDSTITSCPGSFRPFMNKYPSQEGIYSEARNMDESQIPSLLAALRREGGTTDGSLLQQGLCACGMEYRESMLPLDWTIHLCNGGRNDGRIFYQYQSCHTTWYLPEELRGKLSESQKTVLRKYGVSDFKQKDDTM